MARKHNDNAFRAGLVQKQKDNALIIATYKTQLVMSLYTLRKTYKFGNKRLERFIDAFNENLGLYNEDAFTLKEITELLEKETKIKVL